MNSSAKGLMLRCFASLSLSFVAWPVYAAYDITLLDFPLATSTQVFGINNHGQLVGSASNGSQDVSFIYDLRQQTFSTLPPIPNAFNAATGINDPGVIVGGSVAADGTSEKAYIFDKKGSYTFVSNPGWPFSEARGVNNSVLVAGYSSDNANNKIAFVYDQKANTLTTFLPSISTLAQGVNSQGQVVGNARDGTDYGWVRDVDGSIMKFRVNGQPTSARGINDSGDVVGFVRTIAGTKGFVTSVSAIQTSGGTITIADTDLIAIPGALSTAPEAITNSGVIIGQSTDATTTHGFIASPAK